MFSSKCTHVIVIAKIVVAYIGRATSTKHFAVFTIVDGWTLQRRYFASHESLVSKIKMQEIQCMYDSDP